MQVYTKTYLEKFNLTKEDFVSCECCGKKATEIHHMLGRKGNLLNQIENLMAICRKCHDDYGQIKIYMPYLLKIHMRHLQLNNIEFDIKWFKFYIAKYQGLNG